MPATEIQVVHPRESTELLPATEIQVVHPREYRAIASNRDPGVHPRERTTPVLATEDPVVPFLITGRSPNCIASVLPITRGIIKFG